MLVRFRGDLIYTANLVEPLNTGDLVCLNDKYYAIIRKIYNLEYDEVTFVVKLTNESTFIVDAETFVMVKSLLDQGKKLEAVKHLKEHTSMSLKEAKDYVDSIF